MDIEKWIYKQLEKQGEHESKMTAHRVQWVLGQLESKYPGLTADFWNSIPEKKLQTEDLGKTLEYAVCIQAKTPFDGVYRYSVSQAEMLATRLRVHSDIFEGLVHTGKQSDLYDFQSDDGRHLSVKSTKKSWKICPQIIGQTTVKKFRQRFQLDETVCLKDFICSHTESLLNSYCDTTFHSPVLFYNEHAKYMAIVRKIQPIVWGDLVFSHIQREKQWNESTSLLASVKGQTKTIGEFQLHNHRNCVKFRFDLKNLLLLYPESFHADVF